MRTVTAPVLTRNVNEEMTLVRVRESVLALNPEP